MNKNQSKLPADELREAASKL